MKIRKRIPGLRIAAYIITTLYIAAMLCPLLLTITYSLMDVGAIFSIPPRILPNMPKSISVVIDYSKYSGEDRDALKDKILQDSISVLFELDMDMKQQALGEIKVFGAMNGTNIFYQRAHSMRLKMIEAYSAYKSVTLMNRDTILFNDKYKKAAEEIGYAFDLSGIKKSYDVQALGKNELNDALIGSIINESKNRSINGDVIGTSLTHNGLLFAENYIYYLKVPSYMFPNEPIIKNLSFLAFSMNTLIVMVWAVITQIGLCSLTAYGISRLLSRRAGKIVMFYFLFTMMIPFMCIVVPQMLLMKSIGMLETYGAMLLPYLLPAPFYIFLFKGFFDRLPQSLFDAADIDGASQWYRYLRVCLPLSKPIIAVLTLQVLLGAWGDFFWYLYAANKPKLWTINLAIYSVSSSLGSLQNVLFGLSFVTVLPAIILAMIFSEQIKDTLANAGIKE